MIDLDSQNFEAEVLSEKKPVLLCFLSKKDAKYVKIHQLLEELEEEILDTIKFCEIDVDVQFKLTMKYQIFDVPSYAIMRYGIHQKRLKGTYTKEEFLEFLK